MMDTQTLPDLLTYKTLHEQGTTRHALEQLVTQGTYERISPGVFLRADLTDDTTAAWIAAATRIPQATLCLLTALSLHDLTDEIPTHSNIAIPRDVTPARIQYAPIEWHRFDSSTFDIGRLQHELPGNSTIGLYCAERTIIDLFRLRHLWGADLAHSALKRWLNAEQSSPSALLRMTTHFPKAQPAIRHALEVLL